MKLSEFKAPRDAVAKLIDGTELKFKYLPRFMTSANIDAYNEFISGRGEREESEYFDVAYRYLSCALCWIDLQDDEGNDIAPTYENIKNVWNPDMPTIMEIHGAFFKDIEERANFTQKAEGDSSAGSTEAATLTQPTLPLTN